MALANPVRHVLIFPFTQEDSPMSDILHQADQQQFVCTVDGKISRLAYRRLDATTVDAYSTQVPPSCADGDCRQAGPPLLRLDPL